MRLLLRAQNKQRAERAERGRKKQAKNRFSLMFVCAHLISFAMVVSLVVLLHGLGPEEEAVKYAVAASHKGQRERECVCVVCVCVCVWGGCLSK